MMCMKMSTFLQLDRLISHGELRSRSLLFKPWPQASVHFVSHEWLSSTHPDPSSVHLRRLQEIFRDISAGNVRKLFTDKDWSTIKQGRWSRLVQPWGDEQVRTHVSEASLQRSVDHGLIWIDFASVPQVVDLDGAFQYGRCSKLAIRSIPNYMNRSNFFWVLAPAAEHADSSASGFSSWRQRGWCRAEEWANILGKKPLIPFIVTDEPMISTYDMAPFMIESMNKPERAPCRGAFSCCKNGHSVEKMLPALRKSTSLNGTRIPCDKLEIVDMLSKMYRAKLRAHLVFDPYVGYLLCSLGHTLCSGVDAKASPNFMAAETDTVELFSAKFGLQAHAKHGGANLLQAAIWCHHHAMVWQVLGSEEASFQNVFGHNALDVAVVSGNLEAARALLDTNEIGPEALDLYSVHGVTPLQFAARHGHADLVELLLTRRASVDLRTQGTPHDGRSALHLASSKWQAECCRVLVERRASVNLCDARGISPLELASLDRPMLVGCQEPLAQSRTLRVLLKQARIKAGAKRHPDPLVIV